MQWGSARIAETRFAETLFFRKWPVLPKKIYFAYMTRLYNIFNISIGRFKGISGVSPAHRLFYQWFNVDTIDVDTINVDTINFHSLALQNREEIARVWGRIFVLYNLQMCYIPCLPLLLCTIVALLCYVPNDRHLWKLQKNCSTAWCRFGVWSL